MGNTVVDNQTDSSVSYSESVRRHVFVFVLLVLLCLAMYGSSTGADFQFDDIPNIIEPQSLRMEEFSFGNLKHAVEGSYAKNRILVSASYALQYWSAQFLPRLIDDDPSRPDFLSWQFRMFNYFVHIFAGYALYFLLLKLLRLPLVEKHFKRHAWPIAFFVTLIWFCSPIQTQAVTYIVQRAVSMCSFFYFVGLIFYIEYRLGRSVRRRVFFFMLMLCCYAAALFSKEIAFTFPVAVVFIEYILISRGSNGGLRRHVPFTIISCGLVTLCGVLWFYGTSKVVGSEKNISAAKAGRGLKSDLIDNILYDKVPVIKVRLTPRQRLLTESRVVAKYQSMLLWPAPSRLSLDHDFSESTGVFMPGEYESLRQLWPLLMVIGLLLLLWLIPCKNRARLFLSLLIALALFDWMLPGYGFGLVWRNTWPLPALLLHASFFVFVAFYAYRRPLLAFCVAFFYLGNLIESSVIILELVFEHRLYLPSSTFYLFMGLLLFESFYPPVEDDLGPKRFASRKEFDNILPEAK